MELNAMHDYPYLALLNELTYRSDGIRAERTGTGATNLFGKQMRFNLAKGFPLLTTKKVHFHSIVHELLWFLAGDTNIKYLLENNVHIWTDWRYKEYLEHAKDYKGIEEPISMKEFEQLILANPDVAQAYGDIGKGYGHQWRNFGKSDQAESYVDPTIHDISYRPIQEGFDQISWVINEIKTNPSSRRLVVSGWNPHEVNKVDLPPCHTLFQFFVEPMSRDERIAYTGSPSAAVLRMKATAGSGGTPHNTDEAFEYFKVPTHKLSCQLYQRSADVFLGVPFNIASYALLTHMVANECGLEVGDFVWTGGVVHLYANHFDQAREQVKRVPFNAPNLTIDKGISIFDLKAENIHLRDYEHHPAIKAEVAV